MLHHPGVLSALLPQLVVLLSLVITLFLTLETLTPVSQTLSVAGLAFLLRDHVAQTEAAVVPLTVCTLLYIRLDESPVNPVPRLLYHLCPSPCCL